MTCFSHGGKRVQYLHSEMLAHCQWHFSYFFAHISHMQFSQCHCTVLPLTTTFLTQVYIQQ